MPYDSQKCPACLKPFQHCKCMKRCHECGCLTNHTTAQHKEAEANSPEEL